MSLLKQEEQQLTETTELKVEVAKYPPTTYESPILGDPQEQELRPEMAIRVPERLSDEELRSFFKGVMESKGAPVGFEADLDRNRGAGLGLAGEASNLAVLRIAQSELDNRAILQSSDFEAEDRALFARLTDIRQKVFGESAEFKENAWVAREADSMMQVFEQVLKDYVQPEVIDKLHTQVNAMVAKAMSDDLLRTWEDDPHAPERTLNWQGDTEARNFVHLLREYVRTPSAYTEKRKEIQDTAGRQMFELISSYNARFAESLPVSTDARLDSILGLETFTRENTPIKSVNELHPSSEQSAESPEREGLTLNSIQSQHLEHNPSTKEEVSIVSVSPETTYLYRRIKMTPDFSDIHEREEDTAKMLNERDELGMDLLDKGKVTIKVLRGKGVHTHTDTDSSNANKIVRVEVVDAVGADTLANNIAIGFQKYQLPQGKFNEAMVSPYEKNPQKAKKKESPNANFGANFLVAIDREVEATPQMVRDFSRIADGINQLEIASGGTKADLIKPEQVLQVYELVIGRRVALRMDQNLDLNVAASLFAIPEETKIPQEFYATDEDKSLLEKSRDKDAIVEYKTEIERQQERSIAAVTFSRAIDYLERVSAEFYAVKQPSREQKEQLSFAVAEAIVATVTLESKDVDILLPLGAQ